MKYLWFAFLATFSFLTVSCDLTTDDLDSSVTELAVASLSTEVLVEALDSAIESVETFSIHFNPHYQDLTLTDVTSTGTDRYVSFVVPSSSSFTQSSTGTYQFHVSDNNAPTNGYTASQIDGLFSAGMTLQTFMQHSPDLMLYIDHPQSSSTFLRIGLSQTNPFSALFSLATVPKVLLSGPIKAKQTISIGSRSYSPTIDATFDGVMINDFATFTGNTVSANSDICINDITGGSIVVSASATISVGTGASTTTAAYTASGKIDFDDEYGYITIPDISTNGTVDSSGETIKCVYFGTETSSATITSGLPSDLLPTGKSCSGAIIHLLEVREEAFYTCAAP